MAQSANVLRSPWTVPGMWQCFIWSPIATLYKGASFRVANTNVVLGFASRACRRMSRAICDRGTACPFLAFILPAGIVHVWPETSSHRIPRTSVERVAVSIRKRSASAPMLGEAVSFW